MPRLLMAATDAMTINAFLLPHAGFFRRRGWQVDAAAANTGAYQSLSRAFDDVHEVRWRRSPLKASNVRAFAEIRNLMLARSYDLVHVHTPVAAFLTRVAARSISRDERPRIVYTVHGFHFHSGAAGIRDEAFKLAERLVASSTDALVVINQEDFEAALQMNLVSEDRLYLMPGIGIDTSGWSPRPPTNSRSQSLRRSISIPDGAGVVVTVAELNRGKRHRDLLSAMCATESRGLHAVFAGTGPEESRLRRQAEQLEIADRVHFLGFTEDVAAVIGMGAAMVLPSEREGLPRSVMEAMSMGVPVIAADARGSRDLLDGGAGVLFPVGDVSALADAVDTVLSDRQLASQLVAEAKKRVSRYELGPLLDEHRRMYEKLLGWVENG